MTDEPLPGLESNDPAWVRMRWSERHRRTAEGANRQWDDEDRPLVVFSSKALRLFERPRARLDVVCRRRLIARVLNTAVPGSYEVAIEATPVGAPSPTPGGWAMHVLPIEDAGPQVKVACRCSERLHRLDPLKLRSAAWEGRTGKPVECGVACVIVGSGW